MARILYSVQGVGLGHAMRSYPIIKHLKAQGHEVIITANNKSFQFFKKVYPRVYELKGINFILNKEGKVEYGNTLVRYLEKLPQYSLYNFKELKKLIDGFQPQIVITDFEPFAQFISHFYRLPLISIDNQHRLIKCQLKVPLKYYGEFLAAKTVVRAFILQADYYLIVDFARNKIKGDKKRVFVVEPVVREAIVKAKPRDQGYILVYMWEKYAKMAVPILKKFKQVKFIVYGLNKSGRKNNLTFRPFSEKTMVKDLADAKAVVANAGFTLISEMLKLKKPMLLIPQKAQFEQILNALEIKKRGYGLMAEEISEDALRIFFRNIPKYKRNLKKANQKNNQDLFKVLDKIIKKET